jgi:hypothetical protein
VAAILDNESSHELMLAKINLNRLTTVIVVLLLLFIAAFSALRSFSVQSTLIGWYASDGGGSFDSTKVKKYLAAMPFKELEIEVQLTQDEQKSKVKMIEGILMFVSSDVGMTAQEQKEIVDWCLEYNSQKKK